jgi:hypothetical protein
MRRPPRALARRRRWTIRRTGMLPALTVRFRQVSWRPRVILDAARRSGTALATWLTSRHSGAIRQACHTGCIEDRRCIAVIRIRQRPAHPVRTISGDRPAVPQPARILPPIAKRRPRPARQVNSARIRNEVQDGGGFATDPNRAAGMWRDRETHPGRSRKHRVPARTVTHPFHLIPNHHPLRQTTRESGFRKGVLHTKRGTGSPDSRFQLDISVMLD